MHFELLVEDLSGKKMLDIIVPKIIGNNHTFKVHPYKGIGRIPRNMHNDPDPAKRILLDNLPRLLRGHGKTLQSYGGNYKAVVVVVCDLDDKCLHDFRAELLSLLNSCLPKPETYFCLAVEEGEAWLLGDIPALKTAYPNAKNAILNSYNNDSICGTWEKLAEAVHTGGSNALSAAGWHAIGKAKSKWAENITPNMNIEKNASPSFNYFVTQLQNCLNQTLKTAHSMNR